MKELEDIIVPECLRKQFLLKIGSHACAVQVSQMEEIERLNKMRYKVIADLIKIGIFLSMFKLYTVNILYILQLK